MNRKFSLSIIIGFLLTTMAFFFNAKFVAKNGNVVIEPKTIQLCNRNFTNFELVNAPPGVQLAKRALSVKGMALPALVPVTIIKENPNLNVSAVMTGVSTYPLMPDVPILPEKEQDKICPSVQKYADSFANNRSKILSAHQSNVFQLTNSGSSVGISLKNGYQAILTNNSLVASAKIQALRSSVAQQYQKKPAPVYDFIIVYQNDYEAEVDQLVDFYGERKIRTKAVQVNQLPGYNSNSQVPLECEGEFLKECYHFWGDAYPGVSQLAVPSMPGYVQQTSALQKYEKVAFIPGLVRAYVRAMKKIHPIRGVLLVGSTHVLPPYNSAIMNYYYDGIPWIDETGIAPAARLFTDLYYSVPSVPLIPSDLELTHHIMSPSMWSCTGPSGVRMDYKCNSNEWRFWSTPPLSAYRIPPHTPQGKVFTLKYDFMDQYWANVNYDDVVPFGRIVTQDKLFGKDPVVQNYIDKLRRWYRELPSMTNNSIASMAGSTGDTWIYTKEDIDQFQTTFGTNSSIYASEFFVSSTKCAGRCVFKQAEDIMSKMGEKNIAAFFLNGHGGHIAIQAPYGNGNASSTFLSEASSNLDDGLRLELFQHPTVTTIKQAETQGKLIGVIFANSCSPSDYLIHSEWYKIVKNSFPNSNPRSWAEQWIAMEDAGAMNTFLNGSVGWGGSDNDYNVAYMKRVKQSWSSCGTIGDAQRLLILDGLRDGYMAQVGSWQLYNRHFLGSPLNHVARLPASCYITVGDPILVENVSRN
jgi:hypothetical protein